MQIMKIRAPPKLESARMEAFVHVETQRDAFDNMLRRCRAANEAPSQVIVDDFSAGMNLCLERINKASTEDNLEELKFQAEQLAEHPRPYLEADGRLRAPDLSYHGP